MATILHKISLGTVLAIASQMAFAANLGGLVKNELGQGFPGVNVCLLPQDYVPGSNRDCLQQGSTDSTGRYSFPVAAGSYVVEVRDARFQNYVWNPAAPLAVVGTANISNYDLQSQFNFSNFKQELLVTTQSLPELQGFNVLGEVVFLKLYVADATAPAGQKMLYLGHIEDLNNLAIKLHLLKPTTEIRFEIFSPSQAVAGSIPLGA